MSSWRRTLSGAEEALGGRPRVEPAGEHLGLDRLPLAGSHPGLGLGAQPLDDDEGELVAQPVGASPSQLARGSQVVAVGEDGIPTGELVPVPPGPWDASFVGLGADPIVRWAGALELTLSSSFDDWVIFTRPEHALCVEPESGAPNDINRVPHVVLPEQPLVGSITFSWVALD